MCCCLCVHLKYTLRAEVKCLKLQGLIILRRTPWHFWILFPSSIVSFHLISNSSDMLLMITSFHYSHNLIESNTMKPKGQHGVMLHWYHLLAVIATDVWGTCNSKWNLPLMCMCRLFPAHIEACCISSANLTLHTALSRARLYSKEKQLPSVLMSKTVCFFADFGLHFGPTRALTFKVRFWMIFSWFRWECRPTCDTVCHTVLLLDRLQKWVWFSETVYHVFFGMNL